MPTGSHRFGCGEIATGFKTGGFPPCFFCHPKVVPKPPGPPIPPNGGPGGGPDPWECYTQPGICPTGQTGTVQHVFCRQVPCDLGNPDCYANQAACENAIGPNFTAHPGGPAPECERIYDCLELPWKCVEKYEWCEPPNDDRRKWTRSCKQVPAATPGSHPTQAACQAAAIPGSNVGCRDEDLCGDEEVTTTARWRCDAGTTETCYYPCANTAGGACFQPPSTTTRSCVVCTNCVETTTGGPNPTTTVTCDEDPPAGPPVCVFLTAAECGSPGNCDTDPPCPVLIATQYCTTTSVTDCHEIWMSQNHHDPSEYPTGCHETGFCFQWDRNCDPAVEWTAVDPVTGNETNCCCVPSLNSFASPCGDCNSGGSMPNCVTEYCATISDPDATDTSFGVGDPKIPLYGG